MTTVHHLAHRPRLAITFMLGLLVGLLLPADWQPVTRALVAWNAGAWSYLASIAWLIRHGNQRQLQSLAAQEEHSAVAVLAILSCAAVLSMAAIVLVLASAQDGSAELRLWHIVFTCVTVLGSWLLVGVLFTLHYAHAFYRSQPAQRALHFPDQESNPAPDYWDFLYFSFTIAVAAQTADVSVHSRALRKAVLAQSVLSFLFNAAILGLSVNIAASLVGK